MNLFKNPLFWLSVVLLFAGFSLINSVDLSNPLKLSAQTQVVGEGTPGFLAKWVPTGSPTTGAITVNALLDGSPWTGSVNYSISGPTPINAADYSLPQTHTDLNAGSYTITYNSGGPANATFSGIAPSVTQTLSAGGTITFTLNFDSGGGGETLSVTLVADPSNGDAPLTSTITATVGGTAVGTINYTFYCDRNDDGTNITSPWDAKFDGVSETTKTITCSYDSAGVYYPKVIVERSSLAATDKKGVSVTIAGGNNPPTVIQFNVTSTVDMAGSLTADCRINKKAMFSWIYSDPEGDPQSAFQIQVATSTSFANIVFDTGKQLSSSASYEIDDLVPDVYYARLRVWDSEDNVSNWKIGPQFTISSVQAVGFSWLPSVPMIYQEIAFFSQALIPIDSYYWSFEGGDPPNSNVANPSGIKFYSFGPKTIDLTAVSGANSCIVSKTLVIGGGGPY